MRKILSVAIVMALFAITASAQPGFSFRSHRNSDTRITRVERMQLRKNMFKVGVAHKLIIRDGVETPMERRKLNRMKCRTRMCVYRFRHKGRNRII